MTPIAGQTRLRDRFFAPYVNEPMQQIVTDRLRPEGKNDPFGVEKVKELLLTAYGLIEREMDGKRWAMGDDFTMADCAAAPALFYISDVMPFGPEHRNVARYPEHLVARPSFARALKGRNPTSSCSRI